MSQLKVEGLTKHFGGVAALTNVSMEVEPGVRHAIIGPNGAGKSTLFNLISGELPPTSGKVYFNNRDVTKMPVYERANLGLGHTFQRNNLFMGLSVFENARLAVQHRHGVTRQLFKSMSDYGEVEQDTVEILRRVGLNPVRDQLVEVLAYGQQRALEIALALATEPNLLLLDEPTAGMSPAETLDMTQLIADLPRSLTMLIVEHDMDVIFSLAERVTVLHFGQVISQGSPEEVRADPMVQEIYLGTT